MNRIKRGMVLILSCAMLFASMLNVMAMSEGFTSANGNTRMYATSISLGMDFVDGCVVMDCDVSGTLSTKSMSILLVLRQENAAGNLVIVETWNDSTMGDLFSSEYEYSPAIKGREYELSIRVGIYDANGLVGYDYETVSAVY